MSIAFGFKDGHTIAIVDHDARRIEGRLWSGFGKKFVAIDGGGDEGASVILQPHEAYSFGCWLIRRANELEPDLPYAAPLTPRAFDQAVAEIVQQYDGWVVLGDEGFAAELREKLFGKPKE